MPGRAITARRRAPGPGAERSLEQALQETLAHAVQAPYYRAAFGERWRKVKTLDGLGDLPLLDKRTAIAHQRELWVGQPPAGLGVVSSGTTRAEDDLPLLNVLAADHERLPRVDPSSVASPHPGWILTVVSVDHGLPRRTSGPSELMVPWMTDLNALYMLEAVLGQPQPDGRRITALRIPAAALKTFTAWSLERGRRLDQYGVKYIGTHGYRVSPFWRSQIEQAFGAELFDNYSLSEFATPATGCRACGWLHFRWPPVIHEVLDLTSGKRLERGVGALVLTGMFPYVQAMPLIRYDTGDVVELAGNCSATGLPQLRFLGRRRKGLTHICGGAGAFLLAPMRVLDVLDGFFETEREHTPMTALGMTRSREVGLPRWVADWADARTARLRFEVRFDPFIFSSQAEDLEARVRSEVLQADPALARLVRDGTLAFAVDAVFAGTLTPVPDKYA